MCGGDAHIDEKTAVAVCAHRKPASDAPLTVGCRILVQGDPRSDCPRCIRCAAVWGGLSLREEARGSRFARSP